MWGRLRPLPETSLPAPQGAHCWARGAIYGTSLPAPTRPGLSSWLHKSTLLKPHQGSLGHTQYLMQRPPPTPPSLPSLASSQSSLFGFIKPHPAAPGPLQLLLPVPTPGLSKASRTPPPTCAGQLAAAAWLWDIHASSGHCPRLPGHLGLLISLRGTLWPSSRKPCWVRVPS